MSEMKRRVIRVLGGAAAVFALALLTPAVGAYIDARENIVVIWGPIEMGDDAVFKETVTLATRKIFLVSPGGYLDPALRIAVMVRDREILDGHLPKLPPQEKGGGFKIAPAETVELPLLL
jgi:hypothetical protein